MKKHNRKLIEKLTTENMNLRAMITRERNKAAETMETAVEALMRAAEFGIATMRECDDYRELLVRLSCMTPKAALEEIKTALPAILEKWNGDEAEKSGDDKEDDAE